MTAAVTIAGGTVKTWARVRPCFADPILTAMRRSVKQCRDNAHYWRTSPVHDGAYAKKMIKYWEESARAGRLAIAALKSVAKGRKP